MAIRFIGSVSRALGTDGSVMLSVDGAVPMIKAPCDCRIGFTDSFARPARISEARVHGRGLAVRLVGVQSPEAATDLKGQGIFVDESNIRNGKSESWFIDDIIGSSVIDQESGLALGEIVDVWVMPANDVWVARIDGKEIPLPVIDDVIKHVDSERRTVTVFMMPGLLELADQGSPDDPDDDI